MDQEQSAFSWTDILGFLQDQKNKSILQKSDWIQQRKYFLQIIQTKDQQLKFLQSQNHQLTRRVQMLQFALRKQRVKHSKRQSSHHRVNSDMASSILHSQFDFKATKPKDFPLLNISEQNTVRHRPSRSLGQANPILFERKPPASPCIRVWLDPQSSEQPLKQKNQVTGKKVWRPKTTLRSHIDSVRDLHFLSSSEVLVSCSEDCMVKLWDIKKIPDGDSVEPYFTLRGHFGAVLTLTGGYKRGTINENIVYSAGIDGDIRAWEVPEAYLTDLYGPNGLKNYCLAAWQAHSDAVWSLNHHPIDNFLLSVSSDSTSKVWKIPQIEENRLQILSPVRTLSFTGIFDTPTCSSWVNSDPGYFLVGHSHSVSMVNCESLVKYQIQFATEESGKIHQSNSIVSSYNSNLAIAGHEDKRIRFFDLTGKKCVKDIVGHTDSVSSLALHSSGVYLVSGGLDGSLRSWDLRKFQCVHEIPAHRKKYEEAVNVVAHHSSLNLMASGGADSLIKLFQAN